MKFWDREKEKEWLKRYLSTEPNAILFVYGPKSSGKSTLLDYVIKEIKREKKDLFAKKYQIYWFDLRGKFLPNYESAIEIFFSKQKRSSKKQRVSSLEVQDPIFKAFKVSASTFKEIKDNELDPFEYMEEEIKRSKKKTVIVFDELQRLKEIYINGQRKVVDSFFNFFVRLTKVLHLSHVIVMSSDTFFIEEVYNDSVLSNTSEFYLVDFFDDETAIKILIEEGLDEDVAKEVISRIGGVPWMMERVLSNGDPNERMEALYKVVKGNIRETLADMKEKEKAKEVIKKAIYGEIDPTGEDRGMIKKLVEKEIFFYDPIEGELRFQTRLHERAAKELFVDE